MEPSEAYAQDKTPTLNLRLKELSEVKVSRNVSSLSKKKKLRKHQKQNPNKREEKGWASDNIERIF